jgi:hypothetical protein
MLDYSHIMWYNNKVMRWYNDDIYRKN